ncbi:peptidoglycan-binding protein LysM [Pseudomonas sp. LS44]|uniref:FimV/HubP family polar landmark protein n=1 Tax=Pseudomonas sp. LS44 TaxID=1357074 RepID=UPI00215A169C|nr:FimV/HubP family polar landmark protein [Pseudomonas sp. LS44]UVE18991.1 peptidoglycan-binding protein LysM [Pseudomonas sp. LS44]
MAWIRRLLLTLATGTLVSPGLAAALGLGDISLHSALNQPLSAEIQLLEPGDLESHELQVRLAPADTYARLGVEHFPFLTDLRFTPIIRGRNSVIRVVSRKPVREPYLNFIIEIVRPNGHLLREYTLLLDPPGAPLASAAVPVSAQVSTAPLRRREAVANSARAASPAPAPAAIQGKQYTVRAGDSLWNIARRVRALDGSQSLAELMQGIHALNPTAFIAGDSSRLIVGKTLLLPDAAQVAQAAPVPAPAIAEVNPAPAANMPAPVVSEAVPSAADATLQQLGAVQQRLEHELAGQASENLQLQQGVAQLQLRLESLEQQLSNKDQQIAALQVQLAQADRQAGSASPPATDSRVSEPAAPAIATLAPPAQERFNLIWLIAALALLLALVLLLLARRRQNAPPIVPVVPTVVITPSIAALNDTEPTPLAVAPLSRAHTPAAPVDALEGAALYIAYGRYGAAMSVLRKAAHKQPQRTEVQLRLLEVLGLMGDASGFTRQLAVLTGLGVDTALLEPIRTRYPQLDGVSVETEAHNDVLLIDEPASNAPEAPAQADDFLLNLDDLTLDADWDLVSPFAAEKTASSKPVVEQPALLDPDFRSNLQDMPEVHELHDHGFGEPLQIDTQDVDEALDEEFLDVFSDPRLNDQPGDRSAPTRDLSHLAGDQANVAKLDLALAYIDQGDMHSACNILNEVISDGSPEQKQEARALLARIA